LYVAASRLVLPLADGKSQQPFYCRARHPKDTRVIAITNPGPISQETSIILYPPSRPEFDGPYRNTTLLCQIRGSHPAPAAVRWLRNGLPFQDGVSTQALTADGRSGTDSRAVVTEAEWDAGTVYTCQVGEEMRNTSKALECG
ncbi:IGHM protein, partial [Eurystomus gularis]|nr:IGHM protein [Eurystomus gularis]